MKKNLFLGMVLAGLFGGDVLALGDLPPINFREAFDRRVFVTHSPIYPRAGELPVYSAYGDVNANDPADPSGLGIKRIRIWVKVYQISLNASGDREFNFQSESSHACDYPEPYPATATCTYTPAELPENAYVWYRASMKLSNDIWTRDRKIRHTAKLTNAIKDSYGDAYPIYRRGIKAEKFDVLFTADTDYANEGAYLADVQDFVFNGLFATNHIRNLRRFFNIYLNDYSHKVNVSNPDGYGCSDASITNQEPDNWDDLSGFDDRVYAHATSFQDCSQIGLGGGRISSADTANVTAHEMFHSLIGRGDEYPGSSGNVAGSHPNVYDSVEDCEDHATEFHATEYAASPGCRSLGTMSDGTASPVIHWCPDDDVMTDSGTGDLSAEEWSQLYDQIGAHGLSAFSTVAPDTLNATPGTAVPARSGGGQATTSGQTAAPRDNEAQEIVFDSEESIKADREEGRWEKTQKTFSLRLRFIGPKIILERFRIVKGAVAPHIFYPELKSDYLVSLLDNKGKVIQDFWTQDPRNLADEEVARGKRSPSVQEMPFNLRIAWQANIARFRIQDKTGKILLEASLLEKAEKAAPKVTPKATLRTMPKINR